MPHRPPENLDDEQSRMEFLLQRYFDRTMTEEEGRELLDLWQERPDEIALARKHYEINHYLRFLGRMESERRQRFSRIPLPTLHSIFDENVGNAPTETGYGTSAGASVDLEPFVEISQLELAVIRETVFLMPGPDDSWPPLEKVKPVDSLSKVKDRENVQFGLLHVFLFGIALFAFVTAVYMEFSGDTPDSPISVAGTFAEVVETIDARWSDENVLKPGARIGREKIVLEEGVVKLALDNGAELILEGPIDFVLNGKLRASCQYGKVNAFVAPAAKGFEISTPFSRIVDLGTEFSIVAGKSETDIHVLSGKIELSRDKNERYPLAEGEALRASTVGDFERIVLDSTVCIRRPRFDVMATSHKSIRKTARDEKLEQIDRDEDVLLHFAGIHFRGSGTGSIYGGRSVAGPDEARRAMQLRFPSDRIELNVPGRYDTLTLLLTVRVNRLERVSRLLIGNEYYENPGMFLWQLGRDGDVQFRVHKGVEGPSWAFDLKGGFISKDLHTWTTLGVVVDGTNNRISHYKDGRLVGRIPWDDPIPLGIGSAVLGNENIGAANKRTPRFLNGDVGELLIYRRALSEEEISELYDYLH